MNTLSSREIEKREIHLSGAGILKGVEAGFLMSLEAEGEFREYSREPVVTDGSEIKCFYYIVEGMLEVTKMNPATQKTHVLASIGKGQCFGEMSFLTGAPASADVAAGENVVVWVIPHEKLRQFIETKNGGVKLGLNIATLLAQRMQENNQRLMGLGSTLQFVSFMLKHSPGHLPEKDFVA
ncbi:MAG: cyclic nucleotide-binding domain-containing protein [Verrucomicrobiae bacterium]|nr:cyclic nucleotide-binding domain-containing protein [Verrucomicrobiae bacterium]